jgi:hypothetical protein
MASTTQTLPAETGGTDMTRFNALRHGVLSRYTSRHGKRRRIPGGCRGAGGPARADRGAPRRRDRTLEKGCALYPKTWVRYNKNIQIQDLGIDDVEIPGKRCSTADPSATSDWSAGRRVCDECRVYGVQNSPHWRRGCSPSSQAPLMLPAADPRSTLTSALIGRFPAYFKRPVNPPHLWALIFPQF